MRHSSAALCIAALCCQGCSALEAYTSTAAKIDRSMFAWQPPGQSGLDALRTDIPADEEQRRSVDIHACATELAREYSRLVDVPIREVRAAQLAHCMEKKGWELQYVLVLVTS